MILNKEKINSVMQDRGINQAQLANKLGINRITLCNRINHPCREKLSTIKKLADALECSVSDIADGMELNSDVCLQAEELRNRIIRALIDADIPPESLKIVLNVVKNA